VRRPDEQVRVPGRRDSIIRGSALGALNGEPEWEAKIDELMDAVDSYVPQPKRSLDFRS